MSRYFELITRCCLLATIACSVLFSGWAYGQAGLRESLERLDRNQDGEISPEEITPLSRPYLERLAKARRISLNRPTPIDKWQEAARVYHAMQNGVAGSSVRPEGESSVREFGPLPDEPMVPEFGLAEVKYPYSLEDLQEADRSLRRCDRNKDGYIDRQEAIYGKWTHRDPFAEDLDKDDRLSRLELGQRYARRRLLSGASSELVQKAWRTGSGIEPSTKEDDSRERSDWWRRNGREYYLTLSILRRFDLNKNGRLELIEASELGIPAGKVDIDRDGELSRDELFAFLSPLQEEVSGLSEAIPGWFYELDADGDQQISMPEFGTEWTDEMVEEFATLDANADGLLTTAEILSSTTAAGGSYRNDNAEVLPPGKTVISEIEVSEDFLIDDLDVQLSITHTYASKLDAYLTGPNGQRIELFTEVGGSDDHFDETIFDDQSRYPITKARPPFSGTFIPEARLKNQPSLSHFRGTSVKGVWQLVVRCSRSERFGMLHSWNLRVKPQEDMLESIADAAVEDGPPDDPGANVSQPQSEGSPTAPNASLDVKSSSSSPWNAAGTEASAEEIRMRIEARTKAYLEKMKGEGG